MLFNLTSASSSSIAMKSLKKFFGDTSQRQLIFERFCLIIIIIIIKIGQQH
jgi:hypothetical protein